MIANCAQRVAFFSEITDRSGARALDESLDHDEVIPQLEYVAYAMCAQGVQRLRADETTALLSDMRAEYPRVREARRRKPEEFLRLDGRPT